MLSKGSREKWNSMLYPHYFPVSLKVLKIINEKNTLHILMNYHIEQSTMVILTYPPPTPHIRNEA